MSVTKFLDLVKKAFPSATFEDTLPLPVYVACHGELVVGKQPQYDPNYPFVGEALRVQGEGLGQCWNELLIPWPAFLAVVARPGDRTIIEGRGSSEMFQLVYADDVVGALAIALSAEQESEFTTGLNSLAKVCPERRPPTINADVWNEDAKCHELAKHVASMDNPGRQRSTFPTDK